MSAGWPHQRQAEWRESGQPWDAYLESWVHAEGLHAGQDMLDQLAVFAEGWHADAARAVAGYGRTGHFDRALDQLAERSLMSAAASADQTRWNMLEPYGPGPATSSADVAKRTPPETGRPGSLAALPLVTAGP